MFNDIYIRIGLKVTTKRNTDGTAEPHQPTKFFYVTSRLIYYSPCTDLLPLKI